MYNFQFILLLPVIKNKSESDIKNKSDEENNNKT